MSTVHAPERKHVGPRNTTITFSATYSSGILKVRVSNMNAISSVEAMRLQGTRLENYRLAVAAAFYNEGPGTIGYKGYLIMPDENLYAIVQHGNILIRMRNTYVAKVWITCRVQKVGIVEANAIIKAESQ
jgi:hypothetical protein